MPLMGRENPRTSSLGRYEVGVRGRGGGRRGDIGWCVSCVRISSAPVDLLLLLLLFLLGCCCFPVFSFGFFVVVVVFGVVVVAVFVCCCFGVLLLFVCCSC